MNQITNYDALLIPSDGRPPHLVQLMTSPMINITQPGEGLANHSRVPHPEVYMDYIAEGPHGHRFWRYHLIEALDGMNKKFAAPYIVFYPILSKDGMPFPVNQCIREIQGRNYQEALAWRGNIVIGKYRGEDPFTSISNAAMSDFPLIKNYLMTHGCPGV